MGANKGTVIVLIAVIVGWLWQIGYEAFPDWRPVMFLAGMIAVSVLGEWLRRCIDNARAGGK